MFKFQNTNVFVGGGGGVMFGWLVVFVYLFELHMDLCNQLWVVFLFVFFFKTVL